MAEELERLADADERLRLLTVTSVDVSSDLRAATVFLGSLDADAAEALEERRAQVQRAVGRQVRMKRTPRLSFEADPAVRAGERVEQILRRLDAERHGPGDPGEPGADPPPRVTDPVPPTGLLVVDKEPGWTSHDVVAKVRGIFGQRRVGHAGTLDPDATGVLLVGLGRVTRLLRFLSGSDKRYTAEIVLGAATDTLDASGTVVGEWDMSGVTLADARAAALDLTGEVQQVPPMVSAVKVGGTRLHRLARQGVEVDRPARTVRVTRFDLEEAGEPSVLRAVIDCSSGTYVRVLAADLGARLGGGAHVRALRRVSVGTFTVAEAEPVAALSVGSLRSPAEALRDLPKVAVGPETAAMVARGRPLDRSVAGATGSGPWAVLDPTGRLIAVYEGTGSDRIAPAVVLASR